MRGMKRSSDFSIDGHHERKHHQVSGKLIDKLGEKAFEASFHHRKGTGTLYGPVQYIPEHWRPFRKMNLTECKLYAKKCDESDGFDVSGCTGAMTGGIVEVKHTDTLLLVTSILKLAIKKHNEDREPKLQFLELARANLQAASGTLIYLTFWARSQESNTEKLYRAKVWSHVGGEKIIMHFEEAPPIDQSNPALFRKSMDEPEDSDTEEAASLVSWHKSMINPETQQLYSLKSSRPKSSGRSKRPFNIFVNELRSLPEFAGMRYQDVVRNAADKWRTMSAEDKAPFKSSSVSSSTPE